MCVWEESILSLVRTSAQTAHGASTKAARGAAPATTAPLASFSQQRVQLTALRVAQARFLRLGQPFARCVAQARSLRLGQPPARYVATTHTARQAAKHAHATWVMGAVLLR